MSIAIIKTAPSGLGVLREENTVVLQEGSSLNWGDTLVNESSDEISVLIPARNEAQTDTILTLQPGAKAELAEQPTSLGDGSTRTEVLALTEGVELFDVDTTEEIMGLVGAGAGAGAGAGLAGAGLLLGGLAFYDDDDDEPIPTEPPPPPPESADVNSDGVNDTENENAFLISGNSDKDNLADDIDTDDDNDGIYDEGITQNDIDDDGKPNSEDEDIDGDGLNNDIDTDDDNDGQYDMSAPPPPPPPTVSTAGLSGAFSELSEGLNETQLAPASALTDALAGGFAGAGEAASGFEEQDPSGTVAPLLANTFGVPDEDFNGEDTSGASGAIASISEGTNSGVESGQLNPLADITRPALGDANPENNESDPVEPDTSPGDESTTGMEQSPENGASETTGPVDDEAMNASTTVPINSMDSLVETLMPTTVI